MAYGATKWKCIKSEYASLSNTSENSRSPGTSTTSQMQFLISVRASTTTLACRFSSWLVVLYPKMVGTFPAGRMSFLSDVPLGN